MPAPNAARLELLSQPACWPASQAASCRLNVDGRIALQQMLQVHIGDAGQPPCLARLLLLLSSLPPLNHLPRCRLEACGRGQGRGGSQGAWALAAGRDSSGWLQAGYKRCHGLVQRDESLRRQSSSLQHRRWSLLHTQNGRAEGQAATCAVLQLAPILRSSAAISSSSSGSCSPTDSHSSCKAASSGRHEAAGMEQQAWSGGQRHT